MLQPLIAQVSSRSYTADEVVTPYIYVFYAAFAVAFVLTPLMRIVAMHYGIIDRPDNVRKMHSRPVAYLGGIAVFVGWLAGLAVSQFLSLHRSEVGWPTSYPVVKFSIVLGGLVIVILGLWDDTVSIKPWVKIGGQVSAAAFLLWDGVGLEASKPLLQAAFKMLVRVPGFVNVFYGGVQ